MTAANATQPILPVVILSTADADADVWTNKQHIASRLAQTRQVYYVESLGLRAPTFSRSDFRRVLSRLRRRHKINAEASEQHKSSLRSSVHVVTPIAIPFHNVRFVRLVNLLLIRLSVQRKLPSEYQLWSFSPVDYGLANRAQSVVYHSVDLLHSFPRMPSKALLGGEKTLARRGYVAIASSIGVQRHLETIGFREVRLWENVADISLSQASDRSQRRLPAALFAGNMTPAKIDIDLLASIASRVPTVIAGPMAIDGAGGSESSEMLLRSENVQYLGVLDQHQLAAIAAECTVGLIPYQINDYTAGVFPMKVYEYLAAGLRVISTSLPSLVGRDIPGLTIVSDHGEFVAAVEAALADEGPLPSPDASNSWEHRLGQVLDMLETVRASSAG